MMVRIILLGIVTLSLAASSAQGQQAIGSYPSMDGGYGGESAGTTPVVASYDGATASSVWTNAGGVPANTGSIVSGGARSGSKYGSIVFSAAGATRRFYSPTTPSGSILPSTKYTIQFWYRNNGGTILDLEGGVSQSASSKLVYGTKVDNVNVGSTWTLYQSTATTDATAAGFGLAALRITPDAVGGFDIDDFAVYAGDPDVTPPDSPEVTTATSATSASLLVQWNAPATGTDGGGYVVVRYTTPPSSDDLPNPNGIYQSGDTISHTNAGLVCFVGTSSSAWDSAGLSSGTTYYYRVLTCDKAFNYSGASDCSGTTLSASSLTIGRGASFRLAGTHAFSASGGSGTAAWHVDLTLINDATGIRTRTSSVQTASGSNPSFTLSKVSGSETIYSIIAESGGQTDSVTVQVFPSGSVTSFVYEGSNNAGEPLRVYLVVPSSISTGTHEVMVMHGTDRNADTYVASWQQFASANDYLTVAPEFSTTYWPSSSDYHQGNMFTRSDTLGSAVPEPQWTFTLANEIANFVRTGFGLTDTVYDIWGHSAGAQFVHRMLLFKPAANIRVAVAANAGYYTAPDMGIVFPFGLQYSKLAMTAQKIAAYTDRSLVIMRGTADTVQDSDFLTGGNYDVQGSSRYARAGYFFGKGIEANGASRWQVFDVANVGHSQSGMAPAGQQVLIASSVPGAPVLLSPAPAASFQPTTDTLRWTKPSGALMFRAQVAANASFEGVVVEDTTLSDIWRRVSNLEIGVTYYWRVRARNRLGEGPWSSTSTFSTEEIATDTLLLETFGSTTDLPSGWSVIGGGWTASTANVSSGYTGASGGTNISGTNSGTAINCTLTYDSALSTVGTVGVAVRWGARRSASFTNPVVFEWSADGMVWNTEAYAEVPATTTWTAVNNAAHIDLGSGAVGVADLRLRWRYDQINNGSAYRIDDVIVTGDRALPVELTSFQAAVNGMRTDLQWTTASEVGNAGFEVERRSSQSVSAWIRVGFVAGNGTSNVPHAYQFSDFCSVSGRYAYRLKQIDQSGAQLYSRSAEVTVGSSPALFQLMQNYPNPFNPSTTIAFTIPQTGNVQVTILDLLGREVERLIDGEMPSGGIQHVTFHAASLSSGAYVVRLRYRNLQQVRTMLLLR